MERPTIAAGVKSIEDIQIHHGVIHLLWICKYVPRGFIYPYVDLYISC